MGAAKTMHGDIGQEQLNLISRVYDLPLRPENWRAVLDEFAPMVNAAMAGIAVVDPLYCEHQLNAVSTGFDVLQSDDYKNNFSPEAGYSSPFANLAKDPKRAFVPDLEMLGLETVEQYAERPMVQWLNQNCKVFHGIASSLNLDQAWIDVLFLMFARDRGGATPREIETGNLFLDHFAKSVELGRAFGVLKGRFNGAFTALDRFHIGIFVLSPNGSVVLQNTEAHRLVDAADGLSLSREGQLSPTDDGQRAPLKDAIIKAVNTAQAQGSCAQTVLTLPCRSGADPYLVEVAPLRDKDEIESQFSGCLVFIIDPSKTDVVSTEGMRALYSLTPSESEVCKLVAQGFATDDIADVRSLTRETVRNYIKQVLQKTGTKNRAQLVRLALNVNLPIDPALPEK